MDHAVSTSFKFFGKQKRNNHPLSTNRLLNVAQYVVGIHLE